MIIRRRRAVLAGGLALVAGCGQDGDGKRAAQPRRARTSVDAEAVLRRRTAADSAELLVRYDATAAAHPALATRLKPLRTEVAEHVTALGGAKAASPSESPAVPASADAALALAALADAEQRLVDIRTTALANAAPELARLLASVAAAGAGHVFLLKEMS